MDHLRKYENLFLLNYFLCILIHFLDIFSVQLVVQEQTEGKPFALFLHRERFELEKSLLKMTCVTTHHNIFDAKIYGKSQNTCNQHINPSFEMDNMLKMSILT